MSMTETDPQLKKKLEEGLRLYGRGEANEAISLWREILRVDPENQDALDYLASAGADAPAASAKVIELNVKQPDTQLVDHIKDLLSKQRYEEALHTLSRAKAARAEERRSHQSVDPVREGQDRRREHQAARRP